ncbi:glycerate kinase family protein [Mongoliitalea daihaiensis]|uniref:glycerate kinase family protein n=1 Tax=Mongoliitalea daihaiensis TaxID=2782006 RepID=UPI001F1AD1B6|nr:glycerate kinase [Mongoliitalea daihaiensis]UJP64328.1 glycerate kinase [Mongoliitalea daihaiensis]
MEANKQRKILIAPNAFKGTIEADVAAAIIAQAWKEKFPKDELMLLPIADGGDGTCWLLGKALQLKQVHHWTVDAIGRAIHGFYFWDEENHAAYLDVSTVSGIKYLASEHLNPWVASTFGTGELIQHAIKRGAVTIFLGLGGSASVDLGLGILGGLGFQFLDEKGRVLTFFTDSFMQKIAFIQAPIPKPTIRFELLCDVDNTFFGPNGAIPVFGLQKGLSKTDFELYEKKIKNAISLLEHKSKTSIADQASFGAAGGVAYGLSHFFNVRIHKGAKYFFQLTGLEEKIKNSDIIITGEGRYDKQSVAGKGSFELLQIAKKHKKTCMLITSGNNGKGEGFSEILRLPALDFSVSDFQNQAKKNLFQAVRHNSFD